VAVIDGAGDGAGVSAGDGASDGPVTGAGVSAGGGAEAASRRRRPWLVGGGALTVLAVGLLATWLVVGMTPRISDGPVSMHDLEAAEETDATTGTTTSVVTDPTDGTWDGMWSVSNDGRVPVTLRVPQHDDHALALHLGLAVLPAEGGVTDEDLAHPTASVTLPAGRVAAVVVSFGLGCAHYAARSGAGISEVELDATTLGLTRTVTVHGPVTAMIRTTTDHAPGPGCTAAAP